MYKRKRRCLASISLDDRMMDDAVTGLESKLVTALEINNTIFHVYFYSVLLLFLLLVEPLKFFL